MRPPSSPSSGPAAWSPGRMPGVPGAGGIRRSPDVSTEDVIGLVQYLSGIGGHIELRLLERDLQMGADDLFPLIEAADLLGLADLREREVIVTPLGHRFADAALDEQKTIFRRA